jgi:hypothetical protein
MANETPIGQDPKFKRRFVRWLLDSDPSIRWQVMRDLTKEPDELVTAERSRVASEGWSARLLALQGPEGKWGDGTSAPQDRPLASPESSLAMRAASPALFRMISLLTRKLSPLVSFTNRSRRKGVTSLPRTP